MDRSLQVFPIEQIRPDDVHRQAAQFQESVRRYIADAGGNTVPTPAPSVGRFSPRRPFAMRRWRRNEAGRAQWEGRGVDAIGIASNIQLRRRNLDQAYLYNCNGVTAAIMILGVREDLSDRFVEIVWLASHPGVAGVGTMMVEKAVSVSESLRFGGVVQLTSFSDAATDFYMHLDFRADETGLKLVPRRSSLWKNKDGVWRFA
jgi:hypothetical protein